MIIQWLGDLILSQWIWSITFDFYHYIITFFTMLGILLLFTKERLFKSFLISLASIVSAFGIFFLIATTGLDLLCSWHYCPVFNAPLTLQRPDILMANLTLALFVTCFQALFFALFSFFSRYRAFSYICVALLSNGIAALCSYGYIIMTMHHIL